MKRLGVLVFMITTLIGCTKDEHISDPSTVNIRISNVSQFDFTGITIDTSTGSVSFEDIISERKSGYKSFDLAYRYAFIELEINGETYTFQPIDYVGENPLDNGYYTYEVDANSSQERYEKLSLVLVED